MRKVVQIEFEVLRTVVGSNHCSERGTGSSHGILSSNGEQGTVLSLVFSKKEALLGGLAFGPFGVVALVALVTWTLGTVRPPSGLCPSIVVDRNVGFTPGDRLRRENRECSGWITGRA